VRSALLVLAAAALLALAGCGGPKTFKDPHGKIEVDKGENFVVELRVNGSIGYDWLYEPSPSGVRLVKLVKTTTDYPDDDRAGESGVKRFEFKPLVKGGVQTITFQRYFRDKKDERRDLNVEIGD
jgi:predicted secreted protein